MSRVIDAIATNGVAERDAHERLCLICSEPTRYAHMEIDACRACAVFYRRLLERNKPLVCRKGKHDCDTTRNGNLTCKMCRYDRFTAVLSESKKPRSNVDDHAVVPSTSTSASIEPLPTQPKTVQAIDLLDKVRRGNALMNAIRRASELSIRPKIADHQGVLVDGIWMIPTTYSLFNQNTRILISAIYEFASASFEHFTTLASAEKWLLVRNFYPFICVLDSEYRMTKLLPDEETMVFASYTTYLDHGTIFEFLSDTPKGQQSEDGMKFLASHLDDEVRQMRTKMKRWNPTDDEYVAFLGICFWSLDKVSVSDQVHQLANNYQQLLFLELDNLYRHVSSIFCKQSRQFRNTIGLTEYASRMGDAMLIISSIQSCFLEVRSKLGVLKLLDVIGDEMLMAQLHL